MILCDGDADEKMLILNITRGDGNSVCWDGWGWAQGSLGTVINFTGQMGMGTGFIGDGS